MPIRVTDIIKQSFKFSAVRAIAAFVGVPVTIYVATIITPEEYGKYGFLVLWLTYAGLIGPGVIIAARREIPVLLGKEKEEEALAVQNISISVELLYTLIPVCVIVGASFFFSESIIKFGLIIVAVSYAASRLYAFWDSVNFIREKFDIVVKVQFVAAVLTPVVIVSGVNSLGIYALLLGPLVACLVVWVIYLKRGPINFRFTINRIETWRLLKVGIVLQALTLVFWAFRLTDRTIIAATLSFEDLGLYTYAMGFLMYALILPTDFGKVLQPILWRKAGSADSIVAGFSDLKRIAVYIALGVCILIPVAQLIYYLVMNLVTVKYIASVEIFYVLSYNLFLASMVVIPTLVLNSSVVNKQRITLILYAIGLVLNIVFDLLVIKLGYGVTGVAWVTIGTQGLVTLILYRIMKRYIFTETKEFLRFQARILLPFLLTIPFYFFHDYLDSITSNEWTFVCISLAAQIVMWLFVLMIFYKEYISLQTVRNAIKEIKTIRRKS